LEKREKERNSPPTKRKGERLVLAALAKLAVRNKETKRKEDYKQSGAALTIFQDTPAVKDRRAGRKEGSEEKDVS